MFKLLNKKIGKNDTKGFTLIELVVVIAIVAVLAAVGIPAIVGQVRKSQEATAKANAKEIASSASRMLADLEAGGETPANMDAKVNFETAMAAAGIKDGTCTVFTKKPIYNDADVSKKTVIGYSMDTVTYQCANKVTTGTFTRK